MQSRGLHPILSFGTSAILVGAMLFVLEASFGLPQTRPEGVVIPPPGSAVASRPKGFMRTADQSKTAAVRNATGPTLDSLAASAENVSVKSDAVSTSGAPGHANHGSETPRREAKAVSNSPPVEPALAYEPVDEAAQSNTTTAAPFALALASAPPEDAIAHRAEPRPASSAPAHVGSPATEDTIDEVAQSPVTTAPRASALTSASPGDVIDQAAELHPAGSASAHIESTAPEDTVDEAAHPQNVEVLHLHADADFAGSTPVPSEAVDFASRDPKPIVETPAPPPLPLRRPHLPVTVAAPDNSEPERKLAAARVPTRSRAMSLGPPEISAEDAPSQIKRAPNPGNYGKLVWSALARHKPRAGQRGSTVVTFGIKAAGGLAFVRVSKSSGNPRLDQLALATVRGAAPFPAPPQALQARPYSIRIDFH
jgi:protein TonB